MNFNITTYIYEFNVFAFIFIYFFPFIYFFIAVCGSFFLKKNLPNQKNINYFFNISSYISYLSFIYPVVIGIFVNFFKIKNKIYQDNTFGSIFNDQIKGVNAYWDDRMDSVSKHWDFRRTLSGNHPPTGGYKYFEPVQEQDANIFDRINEIIDKNSPTQTVTIPLRYLVNIVDSDFFSAFFTLDCFKLFFIILSNLILLACLISFKHQRFDGSFYNFFSSPINSSKIKKGSFIKNISLANNCSSDQTVNNLNKIYFICLIFILKLILHVLFMTDNIFYFFIAFEVSVIPVFAIMGLFGKRSLKFKAMNYLLYFTLFSAIPFIFILIFIYSNAGTVYYPAVKFYFFNSGLDEFTNKLIFIGFFIPFAVKLALFPFHTWLPEAHVEASTEGSMILSGIMLKLGFFGIVRFCLSFFPAVTMEIAPIILTFSMIGALSTGFSMYKQLDIKKIIAYSSVVHMNIAIFGYFSGTQTGIGGAILFAFSHGVSSAGLFCAVGYLHDRLKTRNIMEISGIWRYMPRWSFFFFILLLSNAGMPGTVGFVSEISIICGVFENFPVLACILMIPIAIASFRNYLLFTQICLGTAPSYLGHYKICGFGVTAILTEEERWRLKTHKKVIVVKDWDIHYSGEGLVMSFLAIFSIYAGICPQYFIYLIDWTSVYVEMKFV